MRRPRAGIGAELVPLMLILATLAGSLGLIVAVHRRSAKRTVPAPKPVIAAVVEPAPPIPVAPTEPEPEPEPDPEPAPTLPPPPPPEDPTPKALAPLRAAEAEQREEAARADRRAEALERSRKDAEAESARWKRRESLVRGQIEALDAKARTLESQVDAIAAERDALARRRDAARVALERAQARPSSAILPHKGPNGTWRRPIAIECRNGMAILQPKGLSFGMLELSEGFGPSSSAFVAAILRESIQLRGESGPDGSAVVPYIFFVIRPDGIRPYYEARTRLEALGITFGYELVDQDTEIDFPDLDDASTWDGSAPSRKPDAPLAEARPGGSPGLDDDLAPWPTPRRGPARASRTGTGGLGDASNWSMPRLGRYAGSAGGSGDGAKELTPGIGDSSLGNGGPSAGLGGTSSGPGGPPVGDGGPSAGLVAVAPPEGASDPLSRVLGSTVEPPDDSGMGGREGFPPGTEPTIGAVASSGAGESSGGVGQSSGDELPGAVPGGTGRSAVKDRQDDPGVAFVWPTKPGIGPKARAGRAERESEEEAESAVSAVPSLPTAREIAARRQEAGRGESGMLTGARSAVAPGTLAPPGSGAGGQADRRVSGPSGPATASGDGPNAPPSAIGNPAGIGVGLPSIGSPPPGNTGQPGATPSPTAFSSPGTIVDRSFELVVTCGPRGASIHPGGYRVTTDALNGPDGLLIRQMKGLVKERRGDDPRLRLEPKVRFLVQPGGEATYRAAKGQLLMSGLGWPSTFQVAGPDPVSLLPSESW